MAITTHSSRKLLRLSFGVMTIAGLLLSNTARADDTSRRDTDSDDESRKRDHSTTDIALDFDFGAALDEPGTQAGGGGQLRIGREWDLFLVSLTPEIGGGYHAFGGDDETRVYTGFAGGRLAVGKIIEPAIFAHVGIARVAGLESRTAPMLDGGLAIDFTLLPLIDIGLHGAYNVMLPRSDGSALKFATLGAHAALVL